ncbi:LOW QUALITY PROTEIN: uncharacterized protein LOC115890662 [Sitophilus oryzae]|uniref:LOW QUALITY PROTEIN: uncharacterized protein LOC115890662 n=1 Tax=Sitophilus oryzae TaxID=7048 RepID=A0A6J2YVH3_SITOR|nr:LOW QUALITY PROTEIN: uncharacterized protein LOC115890662 [Sitophilus oryzae]
MLYKKQIFLILFLISVLQTCSSTTEKELKTEPTSTTPKEETEELVQSETKDGTLEIVKRIKKVNPDGSYTIGYEADDGSFKIESRDVLGNIKGTYGFVDDEGKVKRVSYSSNNASEVFSKHQPLSQDKNKENYITSSTRRPTVSTSTDQTSSTTTESVIQSIASSEELATTSKPSTIIYSSASPRVLLQRPSTSLALKNSLLKSSEGQLIRPEVSSEKPTELPVLKSLINKKFELEKPVNEDVSDVRNNILRRQLPHEPRQSGFNPNEHIFNVKQSLGDGDMVDVYNNDASVTPRPLFTTSRSTRVFPVISSTTSSPVAISRPTVSYVANYQRENLQQIESRSTEYAPSTEEASTTTGSPTVTPVVQIPPNGGDSPEPLVAVRHPFQRGAILVPLSQLQGRIIPVENMQEVQEARRQYHSYQQPQNVVEIEKQNVRRVQPPPLRPLPVQVDENGYIRDMPASVPTPYPLPVPVTPVPVRHIPVLPVRYVNNDVDNDIDRIQPPVSTRDFQKLLNQLIVRQKQLERISALTHARLQPQIVHPQPTPQAYYVQRVASPNPQESMVRYAYQRVQDGREGENNLPHRPAVRYERPYTLTRIGRAQSPVHAPVYKQEQSQTEEYLPVEVREMLLLRMLQLAMNPALPIEEDSDSQPLATATTPQYRKSPVEM